MPSAEARSFWITGPRKGELRTEEIPAVTDGAVAVRTLYSGISRGTEGLVWRGEVPESEAERMRAPFQVGRFPWPVKYGYVAVGSVDAGPADLKGRTVFCLHPHQDFFFVPASAVSVLPDGLPPRRAVLTANMETAVNALWDGAPLAGERIVVVGAGVVGALVARLCGEIPGTQVTLVDSLGSKSRVATALGVAFAMPAEAPRDADLIFHASGNPEGLETALSLAAVEGRIVDLSWYGTKRVSLKLGEAFHARRLKLISSQVGTLPSHMWPRWNHAKRMQLALSLLKNPVFDTLISGEDSFAAMAEVYPKVMEDKDALCHVIRYDEAGRPGRT
jgi:NADPH:quinone reductase-like Zn-dependent oxidoreductase